MKAKSYIARIYRNNKLIKRYDTTFKRRFTKFLGMCSFQKRDIRVYLRINYGKHKNNFDRLVLFYNDGEYTTRKDLMQAFRAFIEGGREGK